MLLAAGADPKAATATGTTPLMLAAASGNAEAVTALLDAGADVNAKEQAMEQTALMFAAAFNRVEAMTGADRRAAPTSRRRPRSSNLAALTTPEEEAFRQQQQPPAPGAQPRPAGGRRRSRVPPTPPPTAPTGTSGGRRGPQQGAAGVERQFRYNELVGTQGGLTPLLFAVRQGHIEAVDGAARRRRRRQSAERGRQDAARC